MFSMGPWEPQGLESILLGGHRFLPFEVSMWHPLGRFSAPMDLSTGGEPEGPYESMSRLALSKQRSCFCASKEKRREQGKHKIECMIYRRKIGF